MALGQRYLEEPASGVEGTGYTGSPNAFGLSVSWLLFITPMPWRAFRLLRIFLRAVRSGLASSADAERALSEALFFRLVSPFRCPRRLGVGRRVPPILDGKYF